MSDFVSSGTTTTKTSSDIEIDGVPMPGLKLNGLTVTKEKIWSQNTGRAANGEMVGDLIAIKIYFEMQLAAADKRAGSGD